MDVDLLHRALVHVGVGLDRGDELGDAVGALAQLVGEVARLEPVAQRVLALGGVERVEGGRGVGAGDRLPLEGDELLGLRAFDERGELLLAAAEPLDPLDRRHDRAARLALDAAVGVHDVEEAGGRQVAGADGVRRRIVTAHGDSVSVPITPR